MAGGGLVSAETGASARELFGALDLGTNNCRLLIAEPRGRGFRVVESFSRIVRLGEGLSENGRLSDAAMNRTMDALCICAEKLRRRGVRHLRAVATQACRTAQNGAVFVAAVAQHTGLQLEVIAPKEEARLAVLGCLDLLDRRDRAALVLDVGGGSTEMAWLDMTEPLLERSAGALARGRLPLAAWCSAPMGVVTLAEQFPESRFGPAAWTLMLDHARAQLQRVPGAQALAAHFTEDRAHIVGTSGAITSLAGMHLGLAKYDRAAIDGLWLSCDDCDAVAGRLAAMSVSERARQPCVGPGRADLVLAGAAILCAVKSLWPARRVRVADRGLREGLLLSQMAHRRPRSHAADAFQAKEA